MRVVTSDQVQVESRILSLRFARVQSQSSRFMQDETGTEEGEASGLPLIHGFVLPPAAALRRVATCGPLQIASRSPSPWSVISDKDPFPANPGQTAGDAAEIIGSSPGSEDGPGNAEQGLMDFLAELPGTDDVPLTQRARVLAAQGERAKTFMAKVAHGKKFSSRRKLVWLCGWQREQTEQLFRTHMVRWISKRAKTQSGRRIRRARHLLCNCHLFNGLDGSKSACCGT